MEEREKERKKKALFSSFFFYNSSIASPSLRGVYTSNFFYDLEFYFGQILSLYVTKSLGQSLGQICCFIERQYLAQIKYQIVEQIGCVDAALGDEISKSKFISEFLLAPIFAAKNWKKGKTLIMIFRPLNVDYMRHIMHEIVENK